jgi:hypothetical protein
MKRNHMLPKRCSHPPWTNCDVKSDVHDGAAGHVPEAAVGIVRVLPAHGRGDEAVELRLLGGARLVVALVDGAGHGVRDADRRLVELGDHVGLHVEVRVLCEVLDHARTRVVGGSRRPPVAHRHQPLHEQAREEDDRRDDGPPACGHPLVADGEDHVLMVRVGECVRSLRACGRAPE